MFHISNLQKLCSTMPGQRADLCMPFGLELNGRKYVAATNGHIVVLHEGDTSGLPQAAPDAKETIAKYMAATGVATAKFGELRLFAGSPMWTETCATCKGSGDVPCKSCGGTNKAEHKCEHCDDTHECVCHECEDGKQTCRDCGVTYPSANQVGRVVVNEDIARTRPLMSATTISEAIVVNRRLLAMALDCVGAEDDEDVRISVVPSVLVMHHYEFRCRWHVFVCGVRGYDAATDLPLLKAA